MTSWQIIFERSVINGADNRQEMLPVQPFEFPKQTWLQRKNESRLAEAHAILLAAEKAKDENF